ncbi:ROK family protein [Neobacillus cucumis]|uniref:ROK family protein n=1 Tax=Neobacillus cucumis TaxID=1740721 RepID=UPI001EF8DCB5|nr:ROK family protein [Neobacillus cucumis]MBM7652836.1 putative NBD/HSP70 family sugar kinase [Neobacillus cucumis]
MIISFDVGGTEVKHGLLLEDGTILRKDRYNTRSKNLEMFLQDMIDTIDLYTKDHTVSGVAISLPGIIDPNTGYSKQAGAVTALDKQNLKELLESRIPLRVEIENDGNCAAIAEKVSGNAINCTDFICLTIGTGIGGGIYINGNLLHGHSFQSGEFGFMLTPASWDGSVLNNNASTTGLIHSYKKLKGKKDKISGETVFLEAVKHKSVRKLIDEWAKNISYGIYNLAATLNPQKILIGGGVTAQPDLLNKINQQLEQFYWWKAIKVPVERCLHQNDAGMLGAMYHFIQKSSEKTLNPPVQISTEMNLDPSIQISTEINLEPPIQISAEINLEPPIQISAEMNLEPPIQISAEMNLEPPIQISAEMNLEPPALKLAEKNIDTPVQISAEMNLDSPVPKLAEENIDTQAQKLLEKNLDPTIPKSAEENIDTQAQKSLEKNLDPTIPKSAEENIDTQAQKSLEKNLDPTTQISAEENIDTQAQKSLEKILDPTIQISAEMNLDLPIQDHRISDSDKPHS